MSSEFDEKEKNFYYKIERYNSKLNDDLSRKTKEFKRELIRKLKVKHDEFIDSIKNYPTVVLQATIHRLYKSPINDRDILEDLVVSNGIDEVKKVIEQVAKDYDQSKIGLEVREVIETETKTDNNVPF